MWTTSKAFEKHLFELPDRLNGLEIGIGFGKARNQ